MRNILAGGAALACAACGGEADWWGPELAEDLDRDRHTLEVELEAAPSSLDWGVGDGTEVWSYNGAVPGPVLQAAVGDTLRVRLHNGIEEDTTIHWHGMRVPNTMDGVSWVQDPLAPGDDFTYEFTIPDSGTFWYHPHINSPEQIERGLYGVVVATDPDDPTVDVERLLVLDDVDLQPTGEIAPFELDESTVNSELGRLGNVLLVNGASVLDGPVRAEARGGQVERWRLVNAANARTFTLELGGADWRVVAEDGTRIDPPQTPDRLTLASGQRVDLEVLPAEEDLTLTLILQPPSADEIPWPAFVAEIERPDDAAEPLDWPPPSLPEVVPTTQEVTLTLAGDAEDGAAMTWTINGQAWTSCEDMLGGDPIPVDGDTPTALTIVNDSEIQHPFHLHGQFMQVLAIDGVAPAYAGQRDTVLLEAEQTAELFTMFDNPGLWMAHCHILEHVARGMMTAFDVSSAR